MLAVLDAPRCKIGLKSVVRENILRPVTPRRGGFFNAPPSGSATKITEMQSPNVESVVGTWFVAHVKPGQEKRLAAELEATRFDGMGDPLPPIDYYLPLVRRRVKVRGTYQEGESVLFPQYLFFAGQVDDQGFCRARYEALMTHRICAVLPIANQAKFVNQLRAVQIAIEENPKIGIAHIQPGQHCRITGGPFIGREGYCERIRENRATFTVFLRIDVLGASVPVEVDAQSVEAC